ncbi:NfeD family protein [Gallaecimonas mangrovi]|uniref:NfeD family protein n=1 Tax=Gallaecimonas mangrovi TaxID=2291597 RepID=UPI000E2025CF|nr:NfeD family protein [Gallaecimonas mangrovi]
MEFDLQYWHWLVFGMILLMVEIFLTSFTVFWFGLGALVVSAVLAFFPALSHPWQVGLWAISSVLFTLLWFRYFKPMMRDKSKAGNASEAIKGESGLVIAVPVGDKRGVARFTTPLMGDDEWPFICQSDVAIGDRIFVLEMSGNTLIVEKR